MSENNVNNTYNVNNKKSTYFKDSQKRYGEKCVKYTVKYTLNENRISGIVVDAIAIILGLFALPKNDLGQIILAVIFAILSGPIGAKYFKYAAKKISLM